MNCEKIEVMISGYVDNELTQQESQQVKIHIDTCKSCEKVNKDMLQLKQQLGQLSFPKTDEEVLTELANDQLSRTSAGVGWFLIILGVVISSGMMVIEFFTANTTSWTEKLFISLFTLGPLALIMTVVRQRMLTYKSDKYRNVRL